MKVWLFIMDDWDGFAVEVRGTRKAIRTCAWAWLREVWQEFGLSERMPKDVEKALNLASKLTDQHGRIEERDVEVEA